MSGKNLGVKFLPAVFSKKMLFWAFLKFEANIQPFKGFGADGALKFNILRGLEASVAMLNMLSMLNFSRDFLGRPLPPKFPIFNIF